MSHESEVYRFHIFKINILAELVYLIIFCLFLLSKPTAAAAIKLWNARWRHFQPIRTRLSRSLLSRNTPPPLYITNLKNFLNPIFIRFPYFFEKVRSKNREFLVFRLQFLKIFEAPKIKLILVKHSTKPLSWMLLNLPQNFLKRVENENIDL